LEQKTSLQQSALGSSKNIKPPAEINTFAAANLETLNGLAEKDTVSAAIRIESFQSIPRLALICLFHPISS
jgi:hypothetical protein